MTETPVEEKAPEINKKKGIVIDEKNILKNYVLAECCKPIPGDHIMGYINGKNLVTIHKVNCRVADKLKANHGNRIVAARWNINDDMLFLAKIQIQGLDRIGLLNEITQVISNQHNVNMKKLVVECESEIFNANIQLLVRNTDEVDHMIRTLKAVKGINQVIRV